MRREFTLKVAAYEPGDVELPAIEVTYLGAARRGPHRRAPRRSPIKIASLIANEPEPALKDGAAPVPVMERDLLPVYIGGRAARGRPGRAGDVADRAPAARPRAASARGRRRGRRTRSRSRSWTAWARYGFLENADNRPFYFAVSEVIREYLGARFGFDSLELTTDELMAELRRRRGRAS